MKFSTISTLVVALAAENVVASNWLGTKGAAYNKWHETELERWLSDHNVPYPAAADRKDLIDAVKNNWDAYVVSPYASWQTPDLQSYLTQKGQEIKKGTEQNKDSLVSQVQGVWTDTSDSVTHAYSNTHEWILDSWTDSQLKAFLDKHGIPNPQPRNRDTLLKTARENYQAVANKLNQQDVYYPGNWLYETWSESDLKAWLDERGFPAPQPTNRDSLVASVRRNSRIASERAQAQYSSLSASAAAATNYLTDQVLEGWSDSKIKEWCDSKGIKVPQGSKRNELIALARKHRERLAQSGSDAASSASSYYGAATSSAGNEYAKATEDAQLQGQQMYGAFGYYTDLVKQKLGIQTSAGSNFNTLSGAASKSAASASSQASVQASKASKSASSAAASASKKAKQEL
ncbi:hypothetical protein NA57DRAFT_41484 [Rhizodiscina lignyota]|uniref:Stress response protein ish1 n=1 Tax=Rhizodiscina lignyota TaxID=1504668 RepID=A0A9P4I8I8_9PEZI|nr:hypothetical protein NA57DRAFT_41484 [Rhizodiscina lignyota]